VAIPRVSVVMAARNAEGFLDAAIAQITQQTLADFEVVVVDDASTDGTSARLAAWAAADPRVQVLNGAEHQGVAACRNRAVRHATGEYIWFTDCDDRWSPRILEVLVEEATRTDADVVICGALATRIDRGGRTTIPGGHGPAVRNAQDALGQLLRGEIQGHLWNKLFRRSLALKVPFPQTRAFSDLGAMGHLLARAERIVRVDEALYTYVIRPGSILNSKASRPRDLLDCRDLMRRAVAEVDASEALAVDLRRFEFAMVYVATLNDLIRRSAHDAEANAVRAAVVAAMSGAEIMALARSGHVRLASVAAALRYALPVYTQAYRLFRRLKWGSVGYW
jgi:glycosyltransferase involved in cell wall biosynthesis